MRQARNALSACRGFRVLLSSLLFLLALTLLQRCCLGLGVKAVASMLRQNSSQVVAFLIGTVSTVLFQSSFQAIAIAGQMVTAEQLEASKREKDTHEPWSDT